MGNNDAWKKRWLGYAGVKDLTPKQRADLQQRKEDFVKLRLKTNQEIRGFQQKIADLETQIADSVPSIPGATIVHNERDGCGLKAAVPYGSTPQGGLSGGENMAYCLFCRGEYFV